VIPSSHAETAPPAVTFVAAPRAVLAACHDTARAVGYRVPCPTRLPEGLVETGAVGPTGCALHIIGAGCGKAWHRWVVGSSTTADQHLVVTASPMPLRSAATLVNGPAWYPGARTTPLTWVTVDGRRMRAVLVPPATNDGSAFMHHVVLIWTAGGHTYGVGFHDVHGIRATLALDERLARGIRLVGR
jgi:hypothetical protein